MIWEIIPLIASYFSSGFAEFWFIPFLALCVVATVPVILRSIIRWR